MKDENNKNLGRVIDDELSTVKGLLKSEIKRIQDIRKQKIKDEGYEKDIEKDISFVRNKLRVAIEKLDIVIDHAIVEMADKISPRMIEVVASATKDMATTSEYLIKLHSANISFGKETGRFKSKIDDSNKNKKSRNINDLLDAVQRVDAMIANQHQV